jgi:hypothetical protein
VTKAHDTGGVPAAGKPFTWTVAITNTDTGRATFDDTETILLDNLPDTSLAYGPVTVVAGGGISCPDGISCAIDGSNDLRCSANGGPVVLLGGSSFAVQLPATTSDEGVFNNPRAGGVCLVDPDSLVAEDDETNNACSDTLSILADLSVTKTHSAGDIAPGDTPFTWTITLANHGYHGATFGDAETIFTDNLPDSGMEYGPVGVTNVIGVSSTGATVIVCAVDGNSDLHCVASRAGSVTIEPGGGFDVVFSATPRAGGTFTNPRTSGVCRADPDSLIEELDENNNDCSDSVDVFHLGMSRAGADLQLEWTDMTAVRYSVWHSHHDPYFTPGADCSTSLHCKTVGGTSTLHVGGWSDPYPYFCIVEAIDGSDNVFATSNRTGKLLVDILPGPPNES